MNWGLGIEHEFFLSLEKTIPFTVLKEYFDTDKIKINKNIKDDTHFKILFPYKIEEINQFISQNVSIFKKIDTNVLYFLFEKKNTNNIVKEYNLLTKNISNVIDQLIKLFFPFLFYFKGIPNDLIEEIYNLNKEFYPEIYNYINSNKKLKNSENIKLIHLLISEIKNNSKYIEYLYRRNDILINIDYQNKHYKYGMYSYGKNFPIFYNFNNWHNESYLTYMLYILTLIFNSNTGFNGLSSNVLEGDYHSIGSMFEMKTNKYKNIKFNDFKNLFINNHKKLLNFFKLMMYSKYNKLISLGGDLEIEKKSYINENFCVLTTDDMKIYYNKSKNDRFYLGSYHFWFTPCYTNDYFNTINPWFKNLKNYARWLQWIEPLITIFFDDNNNKNESKVSYRDIVNVYGGYGTFDTDIMEISSNFIFDILLNKPPLKSKISELNIIKPFKPIKINPLFLRGKEYKFYFPTRKMLEKSGARQISTNDVLPNVNSYIDKLVENKILTKKIINKKTGADIRLGNVYNNFIGTEEYTLPKFYAYKENNGYNLYHAEYKKDDINVKRITSLKQLNVPKELIGFEFRVLDNMSLDKIFIIYHFCLLGMEMIRLTGAEFINGPKTKEWNNLMYRLMKEGKDIKIRGEAKKYFEKLFKIKLSDNFKDWFYDYFKHLYNNYNDKSIILN